MRYLLLSALAVFSANALTMERRDNAPASETGHKCTQPFAAISACLGRPNVPDVETDCICGGLGDTTPGNLGCFIYNCPDAVAPDGAPQVSNGNECRVRCNMFWSCSLTVVLCTDGVQAGRFRYLLLDRSGHSGVIEAFDLPVNDIGCRRK